MTRPLILDVFCCAGGAGTGYALAGFDVIGVDLAPQPRYPFEFHQGDALAVLVELAATGQAFGRTPAAVHTSAPCQASSLLTQGTNRLTKADDHIDLNPAVRELLKLTDLPYVMENVVGSVLRPDLILCGLMFDLPVFRHRYFELGGWKMAGPSHVSHAGHRVAGWRHGVKYDGDMVAVYGDGGGKGSVADWQNAMGINWTDDRRELAEAIPPAYTQLVGAQLLFELEQVAA